MFCSSVESAPPPGSTASLIMTSLYSTGHGDQRDVSSKDSEGGGGWSDSRDEGTGGHHWVHQAGADSKRPWKPRLYGLFRESADETQPLRRAGSNRVRDICVYYSEQKTGELFVLFFPLLSVQLLSFLPASQPLQVSHSSYQTVCSRCRQSEKGRRFQELVFLFFSFL